MYLIDNLRNVRFVNALRCSFHHLDEYETTPNSLLHSSAGFVPKSTKWVTEEETKNFKSMFPYLVKDLTNSNVYEINPDATKRLINALEYNVPHGKMVCGLVAVAFYKAIEDPAKLTNENIHLANILGWCVHLLYSSFIITDDITDCSKIRRGSPCWYLPENVGLNSITDAVWIENLIYTILQKYFSKHRCYKKMLMGQTLDMICTQNGVPQLNRFDMKLYKSIVNLKTAPLFILPIMLAMHMASRGNEVLYKEVCKISLDLGHYLQVQNDFMDCFGDSNVTGKFGSDIEDGKCTWLIIQALQRGSQTQRNILENNYGKGGSENVAAVRSVYEDLKLSNIYGIFEEKTCALIGSDIEKLVSDELQHRFFRNFLNSIYKSQS
ncbi:hypothetical protein RI129_005912 [Pyrocoelia pectoralis]|uniref:Farnesyl pyrophosphate synthase n=1 Tax=Pyrocoelia pectoralis TaxID=417401 RepID=A0AAN7ZHV3_9COLE